VGMMGQTKIPVDTERTVVCDYGLSVRLGNS